MKSIHWNLFVIWKQTIKLKKVLHGIVNKRCGITRSLRHRVAQGLQHKWFENSTHNVWYAGRKFFKCILSVSFVRSVLSFAVSLWLQCLFIYFSLLLLIFPAFVIWQRDLYWLRFGLKKCQHGWKNIHEYPVLFSSTRSNWILDGFKHHIM